MGMGAWKDLTDFNEMWVLLLSQAKEPQAHLSPGLKRTAFANQTQSHSMAPNQPLCGYAEPIKRCPSLGGDRQEIIVRQEMPVNVRRFTYIKSFVRWGIIALH